MAARRTILRLQALLDKEIEIYTRRMKSRYLELKFDEDSTKEDMEE